MIVRGLRFAQQPKAPGVAPPRGCFLTISYPALKDIVYPQFKVICELAGIKYKEHKSERRFTLQNGAEVMFRSLDQPDRIRGIEVSWFGIDEGRNFDSDYAYQIMVGRLRQGAGVYKHAGWVCSTPNGYDWMWRRFHPDSPSRAEDSSWYNAPTYDNKRNLPKEYIVDLERDFEGRWFEQEVLGKFVGVVSGAVFPDFDPSMHVGRVSYNANLPLYSFWDFGIGDSGVCVFAQLDWVPKLLGDGHTIVHKPTLWVVDAIEAKDASVKEWADLYYRWLEENTGGRQCHQNFGDPAGGQRSLVTGTSVIQALGVEGIVVIPAPKRPIDESIIILQQLMQGNRFKINHKCERLAQAVQTYRWKMDENNQKLSDRPVHDWTSHFCDALRYGALGLIGLHPRRTQVPQEGTRRGTMGYIREQLLEPVYEEVLMNTKPQDRRVDWHLDQPSPDEDWL